MNKSYFWISALLLIAAISAMGNESYYYYGLGQQPLTVTDSIISIKFDTTVPSQFYETFAYEIAALDEAKLPEPAAYGFDVYHVISGVNIDSLLAELNDREDILYAYPVFKDSVNIVFKLNDHFVLKFHDAVSQQIIDSLESVYNVTLVRGPNEYTGCRVYTITPQSPISALDVANAFYESGQVKYSHPAFAQAVNFRLEPNDTLFHLQYNLYNDGSDGGQQGIDIDIKRAWEITKGSDQIIVAIIDNGCVYSHEDYNGEQSWETDGYDFIGISIKNPSPDYWPEPGENPNHGVACQGIIFATLNNDFGVSGIAPECWLLPLKCSDDNGNNATSDYYHDAILYAVHHGANIISCSWGWYPNHAWDEVGDALDLAVSWGVVPVFASGNYGEYYPIGKSVGYPANLDNTIAVGAIERDGDYWLYSGSGPSLDVVAPSGHNSIYHGDIYTLDQMGDFGWNPRLRSCDSTNANYVCFFGGTSAACPQVAGILALVRSRRQNIHSFDTLKLIIDSSAVDGIGDQNDSVGWDPAYGYGLASATRALLAVCRGDADNSGVINLLDATYIINWLYKGHPAPQPDPLMADANCSGTMNMLDATYIINYLYKGGPPPPICFNYGE